MTDWGNNTALISAECSFYLDMSGKPDQFSSVTYTVAILTIVINALASPLTIFLNLLVMIAVATKQRLQSTSNIAIACLASGDLMVGAVVQPVTIAMAVTTLQNEITRVACSTQTVGTVFSNFFVYISLSHLVLMSGERYLAIKHPYTYNNLVTAFRLLVASALAWILGLSTRILLFVNFRLYRFFNRTMVVVFICSIALFHITVYKEVHRHERQIHSHLVTDEARQNFAKERRAHTVTVIVLCAVLLSYVPLICFRIASSLGVLKSRLPLDVMYASLFALKSLLLLNSMINPLIYCVRVRKFRVAFVECLFRKSVAQAEQLEKRFFAN